MVVLACALFGSTLCINNCGVGVVVMVEVIVKGMDVVVRVGDSVCVSVIGVGEPGVDVRVGSGVNVSTVAVGKGVSEETGVGVGVGNIGAPNSLHPRSGDMPVKPVNGLGGTCSPLTAIY